MMYDTVRDFMLYYLRSMLNLLTQIYSTDVGKIALGVISSWFIVWSLMRFLVLPIVGGAGSDDVRRARDETAPGRFSGSRRKNTAGRYTRDNKHSRNVQN